MLQAMNFELCFGILLTMSLLAEGAPQKRKEESSQSSSNSNTTPATTTSRSSNKKLKPLCSSCEDDYNSTRIPNYKLALEFNLKDTLRDLKKFFGIFSYVGSRILYYIDKTPEEKERLRLEREKEKTSLPIVTVENTCENGIPMISIKIYTPNYFIADPQIQKSQIENDSQKGEQKEAKKEENKKAE